MQSCIFYTLLCVQGNSFDQTNQMSQSQLEFIETVEDRELYLSGTAPVKRFIHRGQIS